MRPPALIGAILVALAATLVGPAGAQPEFESEPKLEEARQRRAAIEERLATQAGDLEGLEEEIHLAEDEVADLEQEEDRLRRALDELEGQLATRARLAFMHGEPTSLALLLSGRDATAVAEQAALLESLARRDQAAAEDATVVRVELAATRRLREERLATLGELRTELEAQVEQLAADLEQVRQDEERFAEELAREREEARRRREAELRRQREEERRRAAAAAAQAQQTSGGTAAAPADDGGSQPAPVPSGGYACPVGNPVVFADTWGAPRSGGRSHKGVDMMAPHGTPVYAITSGRITRLNNSGLGGISIYMYGDDGNQYYYTHLQGYASGTSTGAQVAAGQHIAYVGSTGNASASAPHLHFEVHPGGGGAVNPYPYAAMACGR